MITSILAALLVAASPPQKSPDSSELPKHYSEYPQQAVQGLFQSCLKVGTEKDLEAQGLVKFCTCHLWMIMEEVPFKDFNEATKSPDKLHQIAVRAREQCERVGFPVPPRAKHPERPKFGQQGTVKI